MIWMCQFGVILGIVSKEGNGEGAPMVTTSGASALKDFRRLPSLSAEDPEGILWMSGRAF